MAVAAEMAPAAQPEVIYVNAEDGEPYALESLCMNCHGTGTTLLLLTKVPHFREIMIASFECPQCGFRNNEVQFTGQFGEQGVRYTLSLPKGDSAATSRQVVKSDSATVRVPELDFEIPPDTQKGTITTVDGLLSNAAADLRKLQEERRAADPGTAEALDAFLLRLDACIAVEQPFTLILDDPAGNSFVEPAAGPASKDPLLRVEHYERTPEQTRAVGLSTGLQDGAAHQPITTGRAGDGEIAAGDPHHGLKPVGAPAAHRAVVRGQGARAAAILDRYMVPEEVIELPGRCFACGADCVTRMHTTHIPFFKEVIIMSNACDVCGYRNSEVKPGGGFSERGTEITLQVHEAEDLVRDVIKAESAAVRVPELDMELGIGTLGGLVTTVEGVLTTIREQLQSTISFDIGDSALDTRRQAWRDLFARMERLAALEEPWTLVIRDPLANSYVSSVAEDPAADPRLAVEEVPRTAEEDEEFGIAYLRAHGEEGVTHAAAGNATGASEAAASAADASTSGRGVVAEAGSASGVEQPQHAATNPADRADGSSTVDCGPSTSGEQSAAQTGGVAAQLVSAAQAALSKLSTGASQRSSQGNMAARPAPS